MKKHILALVPGGIGDQILFFPALKSLNTAYPDAQLTVIVEPRARSAYRVSKLFHDRTLNVVPFDFKDRNGPADWGNLLGIIRDRECDAIMSLGRRWGVGLLMWLTGIPQRVGYAAKGKMFLTDPVPLNLDQYAAYMYHDLVKGLGINVPSPDPEIELLKEDLDWADEQKQVLGLGDAGYVLVHGGSSKMAIMKGFDKIYPIEKWARVLGEIQQRQPDVPIVVAQGPDDAEFVASLKQAVPSIKTIIPSDLGKLAATMANANLTICSDSAPMHLSIALKTYTFALFGPTDPAKLMPKSDRFVAIKSPTGKIADIEPRAILDKIFG
jgi:ADP-heptose:LPS heptosyltransferase